MGLENDQDLIDEMGRLSTTMDANSDAMQDLERRLKDAQRGITTEMRAMRDQLKHTGLNFGKSLAQGKADISSTVDAAGDAIGMAGKAMGKFGPQAAIAGEAFKLLAQQTIISMKALAELGVNGALGAKGLAGFKEQFRQSGVSLENWQKTLMDHSAEMARVGTTVGTGADKFSSALGLLVRGSDSTAVAFRALGVSADEAGEEMGEYTKLQNMLGKGQKLTYRDLASGTAAYVIELDKMSRLTGLTRKQQQQLQQDAMRDNRWNAVVSGAVDGGKQLNRMLTMAASLDPSGDLKKGIMDLTTGIIDSPEAQKAVRTFGADLANVGKIAEKGGDGLEYFMKTNVPYAQSQKQMTQEIAKVNKNYRELYLDQLVYNNLNNINNKTIAEATAEQQKKIAADKLEAETKNALQQLNNDMVAMMTEIEPLFTSLISAVRFIGPPLAAAGQLLGFVVNGLKAFLHTLRFWDDNYTETLRDDANKANENVEGVVSNLKSIFSSKSASDIREEWKKEAEDEKKRNDQKQADYEEARAKEQKRQKDADDRYWGHSKKTSVPVTVPAKKTAAGASSVSPTIPAAGASSVSPTIPISSTAGATIPSSTPVASTEGNIGSTYNIPTDGAPTFPGAAAPGVRLDDTMRMIQRHEGSVVGKDGKHYVYKDSLGLPTVGYGHLVLPGEDFSKGLTQAEADALFIKDYEHHKAAAQKMPGFNKLDQSGQSALIDLAFNMGPTWYKKWPNLVKSLQAGDVGAVANNLEGSRWFKQVGNRGPEIVAMLRNSKVTALHGGLASGSLSGFPATLHGSEMITPVNGGRFPVAFNEAFHNMLSEFSKKASDSGSGTGFDRIDATLGNAVSHLSNQVELLKVVVRELSRGADASVKSARAQGKLASAI